MNMGDKNIGKSKNINQTIYLHALFPFVKFTYVWFASDID
ncbi:hypothetical protein DOT_5271 [Desulfosporosinus sp. OT]|nr:hypothetical protein DOT_5271 [Desulfosporosinus sp. OT]